MSHQHFTESEMKLIEDRQRAQMHVDALGMANVAGASAVELARLDVEAHAARKEYERLDARYREMIARKAEGPKTPPKDFRRRSRMDITGY